MPKKNKINDQTIEQIDYDLKANNKFPPDKLYPETEQNKQEKEKDNVSVKPAGSGKKKSKDTGKLNKESSDPEVSSNYSNSKNKSLQKQSYENAGDSLDEVEGHDVDTAKSEEIKNEIKKFLALRSS